ncbi:MAG: DNA-3-methyladenine glycosylase I [Rickettsiales bacterium]|nr:DNA-3-methyladenine glycosylase I [Rickettsiales bacterium]
MTKNISQTRCGWADKGDELYTKYHDEEWGVPAFDDQKLFEFLVLESAQAGLSWITILRRRENYRQAFANFDAKKVAKFDEDKITQLMMNSGIIRNRKKIIAAINNAKKFLEIQKEFGSFREYIWKFTNKKPITNNWKNLKEMPPKTEISEKICQDLKSRGFQFLGPTICYAYMQATGLVNDHIVTCFRHNEINSQKKL